MFSFLDPRMWLAAAIAIALSFGGGYFKGNHDGTKHVRLEWDASISRANTEARSLEQQRQRRADEAGRLAVAREGGIRADAVRARTELDGLRNAIASGAVSSESAASATARSAATGELLGACAAAYQELARAADGHVNDIRTLLDAWPK